MLQLVLGGLRQNGRPAALHTLHAGLPVLQIAPNFVCRPSRAFDDGLHCWTSRGGRAAAGLGPRSQLCSSAHVLLGLQNAPELLCSLYRVFRGVLHCWAGMGGGFAGVQQGVRQVLQAAWGPARAPNLSRIVLQLTWRTEWVPELQEWPGGGAWGVQLQLLWDLGRLQVLQLGMGASRRLQTCCAAFGACSLVSCVAGMAGGGLEGHAAVGVGLTCGCSLA